MGAGHDVLQGSWCRQRVEHGARLLKLDPQARFVVKHRFVPAGSQGNVRYPEGECPGPSGGSPIRSLRCLACSSAVWRQGF